MYKLKCTINFYIHFKCYIKILLIALQIKLYPTYGYEDRTIVLNEPFSFTLYTLIHILRHKA